MSVSSKALGRHRELLASNGDQIRAYCLVKVAVSTAENPDERDAALAARGSLLAAARRRQKQRWAAGQKSNAAVNAEYLREMAALTSAEFGPPVEFAILTMAKPFFFLQRTFDEPFNRFWSGAPLRTLEAALSLSEERGDACTPFELAHFRDRVANRVGELYEERHDYHSAVPFYEICVELGRKHFACSEPDMLRTSLNNLGVAQKNSNDWDGAERSYAEVIQMEPRAHTTIFNLVRMHLNRTPIATEKAKALLRQQAAVLTDDPAEIHHRATHYMNMGQLCMVRGKHSRSRNNYQIALGLAQESGNGRLQREIKELMLRNARRTDAHRSRRRGRTGPADIAAATLAEAEALAAEVRAEYARGAESPGALVGVLQSLEALHANAGRGEAAIKVQQELLDCVEAEIARMGHFTAISSQLKDTAVVSAANQCTERLKQLHANDVDILEQIYAVATLAVSRDAERKDANVCFGYRLSMATLHRVLGKVCQRMATLQRVRESARWFKSSLEKVLKLQKEGAGGVQGQQLVEVELLGARNELAFARELLRTCEANPGITMEFKHRPEETLMNDPAVTDDAECEAKLEAERQCAACGAAAVEGQKLLRCSRCRAVRYCSVRCQKRHWSLHKATCVKLH